MDESHSSQKSHKSRLGTIVIDCQTDDIEQAAQFWSQALGRQVKNLSDPHFANYRELIGPPSEATMLVQAVSHASRVHLDIETDDIDTEVLRLETLRARKVVQVKHWWVMEAPTGQRFCVVRPQRPDFDDNATPWPASDGAPGA